MLPRVMLYTGKPRRSRHKIPKYQGVNKLLDYGYDISTMSARLNNTC